MSNYQLKAMGCYGDLKILRFAAAILNMFQHEFSYDTMGSGGKFPASVGTESGWFCLEPIESSQSCTPLLTSNLIKWNAQQYDVLLNLIVEFDSNV